MEPTGFLHLAVVLYTQYCRGQRSLPQTISCGATTNHWLWVYNVDKIFHLAFVLNIFNKFSDIALIPSCLSSYRMVASKNLQKHFIFCFYIRKKQKKIFWMPALKILPFLYHFCPLPPHTYHLCPHHIPVFRHVTSVQVQSGQLCILMGTMSLRSSAHHW